MTTPKEKLHLTFNKEFRMEGLNYPWMCLLLPGITACRLKGWITSLTSTWPKSGNRSPGGMLSNAVSCINCIQMRCLFYKPRGAIDL